MPQFEFRSWQVAFAVAGEGARAAAGEGEGEAPPPPPPPPPLLLPLLGVQTPHETRQVASM